MLCEKPQCNVSSLVPKSTLASLSIYFMPLFRMLRRNRLRLEKIQKDFLWGVGALEKKLHLVKWDIV